LTVAPRESIAAARPVVHGGLDPRELEQLGLRAEDVADFSVSTNPLGPSPAALAAARRADLARYPDRSCGALRRALAAQFAVDEDELLIGNGSAELIWLLAIAYLRPGDRAFVLEPTFGEYAAAARLLGAELTEWRAAARDDFRIDVGAAAAAIQQARPRLAFVCNPNNPTGRWLTRADLEQLLEGLGGGLLVVDEAYLELAGQDSPALSLMGSDRLVLLRSMTKDYGLAGLRLGYAIASRAIVQVLAAAQPPWSVNAAAQAAGLAALADPEHVAAGRRAAAEARAHLAPRLAALGYRSLPSTANFWLVEVGDAAGLRARLLRHRIVVRDCTSFGLPGHIRLAARPRPECDRLLAALEALTGVAGR
jgi:L-threonine-O-3-phosphate decarboxylase